MRRTPLLRLLGLNALLLSTGLPPLAAQEPRQQDPDRAVAGGGTLPSGWTARPDSGGDPQNIKFSTMEPGYHLTLGPATILYRTTDEAKAPFRATTKIHQTSPVRHPEGYGLFFGGKLQGDGQRYIYFLVRPDGKYLVKRRAGANTSDIKPWTAHPAIKKPDAEGKATNVLAVDAGGGGKLAFKVNGQEVYSTTLRPGDLDGIVGLRVNHNLDVHVESLTVSGAR